MLNCQNADIKPGKKNGQWEPTFITGASQGGVHLVPETRCYFRIYACAENMGNAKNLEVGSGGLKGVTEWQGVRRLDINVSLNSFSHFLANRSKMRKSKCRPFSPITFSISTGCQA